MATFNTTRNKTLMTTATHRSLIIARLSFLYQLIFFTPSSYNAIAAEQPATPTRNLYRSWVDHDRYSGRPGSSPSTPTDFQQLAYELQTLRSTRTMAGMPAAQRAPYETVSIPRNNLRNRVPLSLIHWSRTLEVFTPEQQRQAFSTGIAPIPTLTNVTIFAVAPVRPTTYRGASVDISLAADDFFVETGSTNAIRSMRIDAGDGNGWQDLTISQDVTAAYVTTGAKTLTVEATLLYAQNKSVDVLKAETIMIIRKMPRAIFLIFSLTVILSSLFHVRAVLPGTRERLFPRKRRDTD